MVGIDERNDERTPLLSSDREESRPVAAQITGENATTARSMGLTFAICVFGVFIANADDSFMIVTYSTIASQFYKLSDGHWLLVAYNMGFCYSLPIYGNISDRYGRKRPLLAAYCLFGIGCIISGTAVSFWQVVFGRFVAGIGGSGMITLVCVLITDMTTQTQTVVLRSYVNMAMVLGRSIGGPLGGWLADTIGWRWSLLGQAPLSVLWFVTVATMLAPDFPKTSKEGPDKSYVSAAPWRDFDWRGAITFAASITLLFMMSDFGKKEVPWSHPIAISVTVAGIVSILAFLLTEGFWAKKPLIPLRLLRTNGTGAFCVVQVLLLAARFSTFSQIAPYFVRTQGASDAVAGAYLVPSLVGNAIGALVASYVISMTLRYKATSIASFVPGILGYLLMTLRWRVKTNVWESLYSFGGGLSTGMALAAQFIGLSARAPDKHRATAISVYYLCQQIGIIIGVGSSSVLLEAVFNKTLEDRLQDLPDRDEIIKDVLDNSRFAFSLDKRTQDIASSSYLDSFQFVPFLSNIYLLLALPVVVMIREQPLDQ